MNQTAEILVPLLKKQIIVTNQDAINHSEELVRIASEIQQRKNITLDQQIELTLMGTVNEIGGKHLLNSDIVWSRLSQQKTHDDMTFDLACFIKPQYENWKKEVRLDWKTNNKACRGLYYAFNCFNKDDKNAHLQQGRGGANLNHFIRESPQTDFLVIADQTLVEDGWLVTNRYLIHRDAFNMPWNISGYATSPYYYLRYNDMIRAGLCWKLI